MKHEDNNATTDAQGVAKVAFRMPDNLTRYRVMAVAVEGSKFYGLGESNITARLELMVRPSPPRFLNFGDTFELANAEKCAFQTIHCYYYFTRWTWSSICRSGIRGRIELSLPDTGRSFLPCHSPGTARKH